jgi:hypothetical protein
MIRFVRINVAIVVVAVGLGAIWHGLDLDGIAWGLGDVVFMLVGILLVSLVDRELFWDIPPKRYR